MSELQELFWTLQQQLLKGSGVYVNGGKFHKGRGTLEKNNIANRFLDLQTDFLMYKRAHDNGQLWISLCM